MVLLLGVLLSAWVIGRRAAPGEVVADVPSSGVGQRAGGVSLGLERGELPAALSGTVRTLEGRAIEGAEVCASCAGCDSAEMPPSACTRTDSSGTYSLAAGIARRVMISATGEGYDVGYARGGLPISVDGEQQPGLDIALRPGGAQLSGTVVDALGGPIPRARVMVERVEGWKRWVRETKADDEGHFTLQTARGFQTVRAEIEGYAPRSKPVVAPANDVTIQLTPQSVVRGRVLESGTGEPVAGVEVSARPDGFHPRSPSALSDQDGQFVLSGLESGRYRLAASSDAWRTSSAVWIDVHLADVMKEVVLEVSGSVRVVGHVQQRGHDGLRPCSHGVVTLKPPRTEGAPWKSPHAVGGPAVSARIDADGRARFSGAAPGRYDVDVRCPGHVLAEGPRQLELGDQAMEVMWTVEPGLSLTVRVVDALSRPVANVPILLMSELEDAPQIRRTTGYTTDEQGRVVVRDELVPGKYSALVQSEGDGGEPPSVLLRRGSPPAELALKLAGSGSIDVIARDDTGKPISGLNVVALREAPAASPSSPASDSVRSLSAPGGVSAREAGDGHYVLGPLKAASYQVRVEDGVNPSLQGGASQRVQLRPGDSQTLQVTLPRGGLVRGKVVNERGGPEENAWVTATPEGEEPTPAARARFSMDPPGRVLTDAEGEFQLTGLRPGARYTLRVKQPFDNAAVLHGVTEGQTVRFVLPASGSIAGILVDARGAPLPYAPVSAQSAETRITRDSLSGPDGAFLIERIPAGHVQLNAGHPALGIARFELELAPGQRVSGQTLSLAPPPAQAAPGTPRDAPPGPAASATAASYSPGAPGGG